jgi:hypothetical protein
MPNRSELLPYEGAAGVGQPFALKGRDERLEVGSQFKDEN